MSEDVDTPDDWDYTPLADVSDVTMGSSPKSEYYNEDGDGKPFFQGNATFGFRHPTVDRYCSIDKKVANSGDILLSIRAPVGETNIADQEVVIGRGLSSISSDSLNHEFLYHALADKQQYLERISVGSTFDAISSREFNYIKVPVPPVGEQERIASVLYTVDKHVEALDQRHADLQDLKHALMQDLLTGNTQIQPEIGVRQEVVSNSSPVEVNQNEDWAVRKMEDIAGHLQSGGTPLKDKEEYYGGDISFVKIGDMSDGLFLDADSEETVTEKAVKDNKTKTVDEGDILLTIYGTIGKTNIASERVATNQAILGISDLCSDVNHYYLNYALENDREVLESRQMYGAQPNISKEIVSLYEVNVPPLWEQERIASVLYTVDKHVEALDQRHADLQDLKHALMQDLLTGKKRVSTEINGNYDAPDEIENYDIKEEQREPFKFEIPEVWSIETLNDVSELITRGKQPNYDESSDLPVLNQKCIYWDGFRFENERYTPTEDWEKSKYHIEKGDLLVNSTGKGTVGRCLVYNEDEDRVIDGHITRVVTSDQVESEFMRYFFESELGSALLHSMGVNGSTGQVELSKEQFGFIPVPVPPLWEQERIASVLYTVDEMIARTSEIRDEYEQLKRGLMQDLLSGEVRTPEVLEVLNTVTG